MSYELEFSDPVRILKLKCHTGVPITLITPEFMMAIEAILVLDEVTPLISLSVRHIIEKDYLSSVTTKDNRSLSQTVRMDDPNDPLLSVQQDFFRFSEIEKYITFRRAFQHLITKHLLELLSVEFR